MFSQVSVCPQGWQVPPWAGTISPSWQMVNKRAVCILLECNLIPRDSILIKLIHVSLSLRWVTIKPDRSSDQRIRLSSPRPCCPSLIMVERYFTIHSKRVDTMVPCVTHEEVVVSAYCDTLCINGLFHLCEPTHHRPFQIWFLCIVSFNTLNARGCNQKWFTVQLDTAHIIYYFFSS